MKKLLLNNWPIISILVLSIFTIWPLFSPGYFSHHDDLHIIRIVEMRRCLTDFQIPCRWVSDMGYSNGYPLFNFYNPFIYYLGALLSFVLGFVGAAKALFFLALVLGPIAMYFLGKELWGKTGGLVSAILFMFAPYRALDAYVRGALSELFAISLIPLIFLFSLRLIKEGKTKDFLVLSVIVGIFLTTHNVSVIIWLPFLGLWALFWLYKSGWRNLNRLVLSLLLSLGLSSFFVIPAFLEKNLVTSDTLTQGELNFHVHFSSFKQLFFDRFWGWGASKLGSNDDLSLQIGWPHWWIVIIVLIAISFLFLNKRYKDKKISFLLPLLLSVFFLASTFLTHNKSIVIWESIKIYSFLQFPWRFLGASIFFASLLGGFVVKLFNRKLVAVLIIALTVALNWTYFRPEKFYFDVNDATKLTGQLWEEQTKGAILDYLPKSAIEPKEKAPDGPVVQSGESTVNNFVNKSNFFEIDLDVKERSEIEVPIFNFVGWVVDDYRWGTSDSGRILIKDIGPGNHKITGHFGGTSARNLGNIITVASFGLLVFIYAKSRKNIR